MLDGLGKIEDYVVRAKALGMPALAIMDHGNVSGSWVFYNACKKADIRPILATEFYFVPSVEQARENKNMERWHVGIIAKNRDGFRTLADLNTAANAQFYGKPLLDRALLESLGDEANNLVCLSGCAASMISKLAVEHGIEAASDEVQWWSSIFDNFYIELMHHHTTFDRKLNRRLLKIAHRLDLPWVVTNDPHYVIKEDCDHHDALLAIQTGSSIDAVDRFRFDGRGYHLRSRAEMRRAFRSYGDDVWRPGAANTLRIAKQCRIEIPEWDNKSWHIPRFPRTDDARRTLKRLVRVGLRERGLDTDDVYVDRAKHELKAINKIGLADFLLIDADFKREAAERGIRVGPGRGSVCGCLVGYLIGIHKIDSVRARLRFDRFLNIERPKMPDIDTDYEPARRDEMVEYAVEQYGKENVQRVAAFQTMRIKGTFQKLAASHDISPADRNRYTKLLGDNWDGDDDTASEEVEDVSILPEDLREGYPDLATQMRALVGTKSAISRHASGIVIFKPDDPIKEINPQQWLINKSVKSGGYWASAFDLKTIEGMGLLKQDFLGLRTLTTISECVRMIEEHHGVVLDPDSWVPDQEKNDRKVYQMLAEGKVSGVFQMEGRANRKGIQEIACSCFEDIISCTSLYRAGPIIAGSDKRFLKNKRNNQLKVIHSSLEPWLKESWGEMIYQEQMMDIAEHCAGFDGGLIADLLAATRFKDPEMFEPLHEKFVAGCQEISGMKKKEAEQTWEMIAASASYLFNRSHAYAYSIITYQTARLRYLYPLEFFTALLRTVEPKNPQSKQRRHTYMAEAVDMGFRLLAPDVNLSDVRATCGEDEDGPYIRLGFMDCKGLGESMGRTILKAREQAGPAGFCSVAECEEAFSKTAFEVLDAVGALECVNGPHRDDIASTEILGWEFEDAMAKIRPKYERKLKLPRYNNGSVCLYGQITQVDHRKTKKGSKFVAWTIQWSPSMKWRVQVWEDAIELHGVKRGSIVRVKGRYSTEYENVGVSDPDQVLVIKEPKR